MWGAAEVLCEFLVANSQFFQHKNVLELGAGTGNAIVTTSKDATVVLCADVSLSVSESVM